MTPGEVIAVAPPPPGYTLETWLEECEELYITGWLVSDLEKGDD